VVDTGIGISKEHLESIWQPYFQVANSERNRERGLGLGLFLVHRALDHLPGHSLELRSRPGRGSRFTLRLPGSWFNRPEVEPTRSSTLTDEELDALSGGYVLLLEDDREARHALQELLSDWGLVFASGATLEELIADADDGGRIADALITDYRLPGGRTGVDCIAALRERFDAPIPAVVITGESDLAAVRSRLPAGAKLLQKPFDPAALARPLLDAVRAARRIEDL
jgi:CheY-like chemotaxis protein